MNKKLAKQAIKGDEQAFEELVQKESEKLYRTAFLYVRNQEDALDVVQDAVCKAFTSIHKLKNPTYFSTWLIKILIHTAYDHLKKQKRLVLTGDAFLENIHGASGPNSEDQIDLINAISHMNRDYQTVIVLFYYHDHPIQTIAEMMGKPEGTVKTYLHRAKSELKKLLEGNHYGKRMV